MIRTIRSFHWLWCLLLIIVQGCAHGDDEQSGSEPLADPFQVGPFAIGQTTYEGDEEVRYLDPMTGTERGLRMVVWYPTDETRGGSPLFQREDVTLDVSVSQTLNTYPLIVFSHGASGFAEASYMLMERWASHGFIVAAPDHTGDTAANDGDPRPTEMYSWRPLDVSAVIDWFQASDASHRFKGRVDDRILVSGHSYGGYTTFLSAGASFSDAAFADCIEGANNAFCRTMTPEYEARMREGFGDSRVKAVVPIAAGNSYELGPEGVADISVPTMMITGALDRNCSEEAHGDPYWDALNGNDDIRVQLLTAGHHTFTLTCDVFSDLGQNDNGCTDANIEPELGQNITAAYVLAFAWKHLDGVVGYEPLLSGATSLDESVVVYTKSP